MILKLENVSIRYIMGDFKDIGLKEYVVRKLKKDYHIREFWADQRISFSLERGDMLGIIGTNGAGKSTLLKAVSGIMEPTYGRVIRKGSIAALLELGSGFDGDLTVRENTYLRGAMLGYTRQFMDEKYDEIIDFSELVEFEDRPFKQLSSGMKSRLAFAIASLVNPDILILDEVLSVGDGAFKQKSEQKMREVLSGGTTGILVSHSLSQVRDVCNKVLWLHKGQQIAFGETKGICDLYESFLKKRVSISFLQPKQVKLQFAGFDYLIVGAGLFGAVFANEMTKRGKTCLVIDRRNHVGGNLYCENVDGIQVHRYGAHIFHTDRKEIWDYVNQYAAFEPYIHSPMASYQGLLYHLPFNMYTFEAMWGVKTPEEAQAIISKQIEDAGIAEPQNLEEAAISMVGRDIYECLIKGYTEKQWGRSCRDLPPFIIRRIPLRFSYENNYFDDAYQGIPRDGYNSLINRLLEKSTILLNTDYDTFIKENPKAASRIIYTGAIDEYFGYSLGELEYRGLRFETELLEQDDFQGYSVVNYTDRSIPFTRIIEHKHFNHTETQHTIISREYPIDYCRGDERYYPINDEKNQMLYNRYIQIAKSNLHIRFCGRLGQYKYYDMDDTIEAALQAVKEELG